MGCVRLCVRMCCTLLCLALCLIVVSFFIPPYTKVATATMPPNGNEFFPFFIKTKEGKIIRDTNFPVNLVPSSIDDQMSTDVSTKDVIISKDPNVTIRLFKPKLITKSEQKLPILIYFHGGGFCIGSAFERNDTIYLKKVTRESNALAVSVEYRLFPEHALPAAYDDALTALKWVANQKGSTNDTMTEPWLVEYGDFNRIFIGGDSSGANVAHVLAMELGQDSSLPKVVGAFLAMPYFLGTKPVPSEPKNFQQLSIYKIWRYVCPSCKDGEDDWHINPMAPGAPSLSGLGCQKMIVYIADKDELKARNAAYVNGIRESGWKGDLEVYTELDKPHVFHIQDPEDPDSTMTLVKRLAQFLNV